MWSATALHVHWRLWLHVVLFAAVVIELFAGPAIVHARSWHHGWSRDVSMAAPPVVDPAPPSAPAVPPAVKPAEPSVPAAPPAAVAPAAVAPAVDPPTVDPALPSAPAVPSVVEAPQSSLTAAVTSPPTSAATVSGWIKLSGGYFGAGNFTGANYFASWRTTPVPVVGDYTAGTWADIANPWELAQWRGRGRKVDLAVWMFPAGTNVADVIAGRYDAYYRQLGAAVRSFGVANVTLRLGWEMNGNWYVWGAGRISTASYVAAWRRIVTLVRSQAPGAMFTWCPTAGKLTNAQVEAYYPGDAYTTFIGLDTYDNNGGWTNIREGVAGLRWHRSFSWAHHKPMAFPEWGLVDRGNWGQGDNPTYVANMSAWIKESNVAYQLYFEFDAPDGLHELQNGQYPQGAGRYKALF